jgi:hypothetical protein
MSKGNTMKQWNYREIVSMLSSGNYVPFQGNTMSGMWVGGEYRVWSYGACIGIYRETGWELETRKYSVTTSKHQGYLRRAVA